MWRGLEFGLDSQLFKLEQAKQLCIWCDVLFNKVDSPPLKAPAQLLNFSTASPRVTNGFNKTPWWWYFRQAYNIFTLVKFAKLSPNPLSSSRRQDKVISESRTEGRHQQNWWSICIVTIMSVISRIVLSKNFFVLNMSWYVIMWMTLFKEANPGHLLSPPFSIFFLLTLKWSGLGNVVFPSLI